MTIYNIFSLQHCNKNGDANLLVYTISIVLTTYVVWLHAAEEFTVTWLMSKDAGIKQYDYT